MLAHDLGGRVAHDRVFQGLVALGALLPGGAMAWRLAASGQGFSVWEAWGPWLAEATMGGLTVLVCAALVRRGLRQGLQDRIAPWAFAALTAIALGLSWSGLPHGAPPAGVRAPAPGPRAADTPPTIVLLTLDTLRRDHVSAYPDARVPDLTPRLARLAADGLRVDHARAEAPLTLPSHLTMLTGVSPAEHGVLKNGWVLREPVRAAPLDLAARGYRTGAFVSTSVLHGAHGLGAWFHTYRDALGDDAVSRHLPLVHALMGTPAPAGTQKQDGEVTVARALRWLDAQPQAQPVLMWVHLYDAHTPHRHGTRTPSAWDALPHPCTWAGHPSQRARTTTPLSTGRQRIVDPDACAARDWSSLEQGVGSYAAEVAHLDTVVGQLLDGLAARDRLDDAWILAVADHGESLTEHQQFLEHQYDLHEPVLQVPWILRPPLGTTLPAGPVLAGPVRTGRVAATLRAIAGDPNALADSLLAPSPPSDHPTVAIGPAPLPPGDDRFQIAVRDLDLNAITGPLGRIERYDLAVDPHEVHPWRAEEDPSLPIPPPLPAGPPEDPRRPAMPMGLPGLPDPRDILKGARTDRVHPDDEHAWRALPPARRSDFAALEAAGLSLRTDIRDRRDHPTAPDDVLPTGIRQSLEALGYVD